MSCACLAGCCEGGRAAERHEKPGLARRGHPQGSTEWEFSYSFAVSPCPLSSHAPCIVPTTVFMAHCIRSCIRDGSIPAGAERCSVSCGTPRRRTPLLPAFIQVMCNLCRLQTTSLKPCCCKVISLFRIFVHFKQRYNHTLMISMVSSIV